MGSNNAKNPKPLWVEDARKEMEERIRGETPQQQVLATQKLLETRNSNVTLPQPIYGQTYMHCRRSASAEKFEAVEMLVKHEQGQTAAVWSGKVRTASIAIWPKHAEEEGIFHQCTQFGMHKWIPDSFQKIPVGEKYTTPPGENRLETFTDSGTLLYLAEKDFLARGGYGYYHFISEVHSKYLNKASNRSV
jgi:hypothetical protein